MDLSTLTIQQLQDALDARTGATLDPVSAAIDVRAGLALHKPANAWTQDDITAVRLRALQVIQTGR